LQLVPLHVGVDNFGGLLKQLARLGLLKLHFKEAGKPETLCIGPGDFAPLVGLLALITTLSFFIRNTNCETQYM
jgi:hypothetical protein